MKPALAALLLSLPISSGQSRVQPETVLTGDSGNAQMVVGPKRLILMHYWGGLAHRKGPGTQWARRVGKPRRSPCALAVSGGRLYFSESGTFGRKRAGAIRYVDLARPKVTRDLVRGLRGPDSLVVRGRTLYWIDHKDGGVRRWRKGGVRWLASAGRGRWYLRSCRRRLAADATHLYFFRVPRRKARSTALGASIIRVPQRGGRSQILARLPHQGESIAVDDRFVYFSAPDVNRRRAIYRLAKGGGTPQILFRSTFLANRGLLVRGGYVYALETNYPSGFVIQRQLRTGGNVSVLHRGRRYGSQLTTDGTHLYWMASGHLPGECKKFYPGCGQNPMPARWRCTVPRMRIERLRLP